jgi:hypothetical protein
MSNPNSAQTSRAKRYLEVWRWRLNYRQNALLRAKRAGNKKRISYLRRKVAFAKRKVAFWTRKALPMRLRALEAAESLVGVMEVGGNNRGPMVNRIILANDGAIGEPWCGDFVAYCYRQAGSKAVTRSWASVRLLGSVSGVQRVSKPLAGDLVRFNFDHVGMFVRDAGAFIETIEGNTGATGAVSDSRTGGDGVYRKRRPKSLVADYLRVTK